MLVTSLASVMMNAGGLAVAMSDRAWRAVRHASDAGVSGRPYVTLHKNLPCQHLHLYLYLRSKKPEDLLIVSSLSHLNIFFDLISIYV